MDLEKSGADAHPRCRGPRCGTFARRRCVQREDRVELSWASRDAVRSGSVPSTDEPDQCEIFPTRLYCDEVFLRTTKKKYFFEIFSETIMATHPTKIRCHIHMLQSSTPYRKYHKHFPKVRDQNQTRILSKDTPTSHSALLSSLPRKLALLAPPAPRDAASLGFLCWVAEPRLRTLRWRAVRHLRRAKPRSFCVRFPILRRGAPVRTSSLCCIFTRRSTITVASIRYSLRRIRAHPLPDVPSVLEK